jgi:curved DNA-binding protein
MTEAGAFVDYYDILQVNPACDAKMLENAYRYLAKMYHPDHPETADVDRFNIVVEAYRVLRNAEQRAEYDLLHAAHVQDVIHEYSSADASDSDDRVALDDNDAHIRILTILYRKRREKAQDAGVAGFYLQQLLGCSDEHFEFYRWYLKAKGWVEVTEQGTLAITIDGVDHVVSMSRTHAAEKLLIGRPTDLPGTMDD